MDQLILSGDLRPEPLDFLATDGPDGRARCGLAAVVTVISRFVESERTSVRLGLQFRGNWHCGESLLCDRRERTDLILERAMFRHTEYHAVFQVIRFCCCSGAR